MPTERENLITELRQFSASMRSPRFRGATPLMDLDLTIPQLRTILLLAESEPMRMSPLAEELSISVSACSHLVDKLVRYGFVTRSADLHDRRVVHCSLTEKGRALADRVRQSIPFERQEFLDRLTMEELRVIVQAMTIFQRAMAELEAKLSKPSPHQRLSTGPRSHAKR